MEVDLPTKAPEVTINGSSERSSSAASKSPPPSRAGVRSASSKFANLRAAFEKEESTDGSSDRVKRSLTSSDRRGNARNEKIQEHEAEIVRLKDELEKEKELRLSARESESNNGNAGKKELEAEIARLNDELEREKDLRFEFEEKVTSQEDEIEELNSKIEEKEAALREEYERRSQLEKSETQDRLSVMESEARSRASSLQKEISSLKRSISTSTRRMTQTSDTTFRQEIGILQHEVQNWVVHNYRKVKNQESPEELCARLKKVAEPRQAEWLRPVYRSFDASAKLSIYQATVACYMMEIFEEPLLFGLRSSQHEWAKRVRQAAQTLPSVLEPVDYHRWRAVTFDALRQSQTVVELMESAANGIAEMICITLKAITQSEDRETRLPSLKSIVKRAISLAHLIRVQQVHYGFSLPSPGDPFNAASMDDILVGSDASTERTVRCATFPSLFKISDEDGNRLDLPNVIVRAKVVCNEDRF